MFFDFSRCIQGWYQPKSPVHYLDNRSVAQPWTTFSRTQQVVRTGVIELMPVSDAALYAFKYVNGHPKNTQNGMLTVMAFGAPGDVDTGKPVLLSEITLTTAIRTAATSALAARYLARPDSRRTALIGNGSQSEFEPGMHLNAVGGDCPGKTELHRDIVERARVMVEYEPQSRIEGEIQQMPVDSPVIVAP